MRLFVGIATSGREAILEHALRSVAGQSRPPEVVFVCRPLGEPASPAPSPAGLDVVNLFAEKGSCTQRNAILDALEGKGGALLIMDDDIILHPRYLERIERLFCAHPEVAIANGRLLADGIGGAGIAPPEAERLIAAEPDAAVEPSPAIMERETAYGCNMATNLDLAGSLRFDENLPLYAWQEDVDYSARVRALGRVVATSLPVGVHLGVKSGRTSGLRLGYSQIANPIYLLRKGTMTSRHALGLMGRNLAMNLLRSLRPEPHIDRRGRIRGNLAALVDLARRRLRPDRILQM